MDVGINQIKSSNLVSLQGAEGAKLPPKYDTLGNGLKISDSLYLVADLLSQRGNAASAA